MAGMRLLYTAAGSVCLVVGFVGMFLPLLPTTPFVLLAAFFFSRGSARLHRWLMTHPRLGPTITDWQDNRVIRPRAKWTATAMITVAFSATLIRTALPLPIKLIIAATGIGVILLIHSYPSAPGQREPR